MVTAVKVTMTGWTGVQRYLRGLPHKTKIQGKALTKRIAKFIVRSAKQRVGPMKTGTGKLMRSIKAMPITNGYVVTAGEGAVNKAGVNYARFQEYGFKPHYIHRDMIATGSRLRRLHRTGKDIRDFLYVSKWTPFMGPAFRKALNRLDNIELKRTANRIVK